mgnify:CR=1 FL=1
MNIGLNSAAIQTDGFVLVRKLGHPELVFNQKRNNCLIDLNGGEGDW